MHIGGKAEESSLRSAVSARLRDMMLHVDASFPHDSQPEADSSTYRGIRASRPWRRDVRERACDERGETPAGPRGRPGRRRAARGDSHRFRREPGRGRGDQSAGFARLRGLGGRASARGGSAGVVNGQAVGGEARVGDIGESSDRCREAAERRAWEEFVDAEDDEILPGFDEMAETVQRLRGYAAVMKDGSASEKARSDAVAAHRATRQTLEEFQAVMGYQSES